MTQDKIQQISTDLSRQNWSIQADFFSPELISALKLTAHTYKAEGKFKPAKLAGGKLQSTIRNDETCWIDPTHSEPERRFWQEMESLRLHLNKDLFLSLFELEAHFACYQKGSFYKKHLDQFQTQSQRKVSAVIYLNDVWHHDDGGELVLYDWDNTIIHTVLPKAGTLVCFLSDKIPHEVKPANKERWSIAGWFRTRA